MQTLFYDKGMTEKTFIQKVLEMHVRMDKLEESFMEQKIELFAIGIEVDEIKRGLDDIQLSRE